MARVAIVVLNWNGADDAIACTASLLAQEDTVPDIILVDNDSHDDSVALLEQYIAKLKTEHEDNEKILKKLDKYLDNFDVKKFMKKNPNMTSPDFYMVMFNETEGLVR